MDDLADPRNDPLTLSYGIADVLPGYLHSMTAHLLPELDDLADGI